MVLGAVALLGCAGTDPDARVVGAVRDPSGSPATDVVGPDGGWTADADEACEAVLPVTTVADATGLAVELVAAVPEDLDVAPDEVTWQVLCTYEERGADATTRPWSDPVVVELIDGGTDTGTVEPGPTAESLEVGGLPAVFSEPSYLTVLGATRTVTLHLGLDHLGDPGARDAALALGEVASAALR